MGHGEDSSYCEEAVPGCNGVALCEEDVVSMDRVELKRLGWGAVQSSLVAQTDPGLDLLQHLHDGQGSPRITQGRTSDGSNDRLAQCPVLDWHVSPAGSPVAAP